MTEWLWWLCGKEIPGKNRATWNTYTIGKKCYVTTTLESHFNTGEGSGVAHTRNLVCGRYCCGFTGWWQLFICFLLFLFCKRGLSLSGAHQTACWDLAQSVFLGFSRHAVGACRPTNLLPFSLLGHDLVFEAILKGTCHFCLDSS